MADRRRTRTPQRAQTNPPDTWTAERIRALGVTTDVVTAGRILGVSRNSAYALARRGAFPLPIIKAGNQYRVPVAAILATLAPEPPKGGTARGEPE
jgi:hypothetical protein